PEYQVGTILRRLTRRRARWRRFIALTPIIKRSNPLAAMREPAGCGDIGNRFVSAGYLRQPAYLPLCAEWQAMQLPAAVSSLSFALPLALPASTSLAASTRSLVFVSQLDCSPFGGLFSCRAANRPASFFFSSSVASPLATFFARPPFMATFMTSLIATCLSSWAPLFIAK